MFHKDYTFLEDLGSALVSELERNPAPPFRPRWLDLHVRKDGMLLGLWREGLSWLNEGAGAGEPAVARSLEAGL